MSVIDLKATYRKQMLQKRSVLPINDKKSFDFAIMEYVLRIIADSNYQNIHCYLPMGTEINLYPLIDALLDSKKTIVCPKTLPNRKLQHFILESLDELEGGVFGTQYPKKAKGFNSEYDLIIVPGLAYDTNKYRLGYGGGYYDNFLINHPSSQKLGLFYSFQELDTIPIESHDIRLDTIITENGMV